jgi:hypothetical protein
VFKTEAKYDHTNDQIYGNLPSGECILAKVKNANNGILNLHIAVDFIYHFKRLTYWEEGGDEM